MGNDASAYFNDLSKSSTPLESLLGKAAVNRGAVFCICDAANPDQGARCLAVPRPQEPYLAIKALSVDDTSQLFTLQNVTNADGEVRTMVLPFWDPDKPEHKGADPKEAKQLVLAWRTGPLQFPELQALDPLSYAILSFRILLLPGCSNFVIATGDGLVWLAPDPTRTVASARSICFRPHRHADIQRATAEQMSVWSFVRVADCELDGRIVRLPHALQQPHISVPGLLPRVGDIVEIVPYNCNGGTVALTVSQQSMDKGKNYSVRFATRAQSTPECTRFIVRQLPSAASATATTSADNIDPTFYLESCFHPPTAATNGRLLLVYDAAAQALHARFIETNSNKPVPAAHGVRFVPNTLARAALRNKFVLQFTSPNPSPVMLQCRHSIPPPQPSDLGFDDQLARSSTLLSAQSTAEWTTAMEFHTVSHAPAPSLPASDFAEKCSLLTNAETIEAGMILQFIPRCAPHMRLVPNPKYQQGQHNVFSLAAECDLEDLSQSDIRSHFVLIATAEAQEQRLLVNYSASRTSMQLRFVNRDANDGSSPLIVAFHPRETYLAKSDLAVSIREPPLCGGVGAEPVYVTPNIADPSQHFYVAKFADASHVFRRFHLSAPPAALANHAQHLQLSQEQMKIREAYMNNREPISTLTQRAIDAWRTHLDRIFAAMSDEKQQNNGRQQEQQQQQQQQPQQLKLSETVRRFCRAEQLEQVFEQNVKLPDDVALCVKDGAFDGDGNVSLFLSKALKVNVDTVRGVRAFIIPKVQELVGKGAAPAWLDVALVFNIVARGCTTCTAGDASDKSTTAMSQSQVTTFSVLADLGAQEDLCDLLIRLCVLAGNDGSIAAASRARNEVLLAAGKLIERRLALELMREFNSASDNITNNSNTNRHVEAKKKFLQLTALDAFDDVRQTAFDESFMAPAMHLLRSSEFFANDVSLDQILKAPAIDDYPFKSAANNSVGWVSYVPPRHRNQPARKWEATAEFMLEAGGLDFVQALACGACDGAALPIPFVTRSSSSPNAAAVFDEHFGFFWHPKVPSFAAEAAGEQRRKEVALARLPDGCKSPSEVFEWALAARRAANSGDDAARLRLLPWRVELENFSACCDSIDNIAAKLDVLLVQVPAQTRSSFWRLSEDCFPAIWNSGLKSEAKMIQVLRELRVFV